jgi:hypothetical protein
VTFAAEGTSAVNILCLSGVDSMITAPIPNAKATLAMLSAAYEADQIDRCGHGKTWDVDCAECCAIWREERIKDLVKQAAKYGFRLVPMTDLTPPKSPP